MHPIILAGIGGGHKGTATPQLGALSNPLSHSIGSTGERPIVRFEFRTDGVIAEAVGDTGALLVTTPVGNWLDDITGLDNTDWEVAVTIVSEDTGDPGTWFPTPPGTFQVLSSLRGFNWQKDGTDDGTANSVLTITLRQVSNTSNSVTRGGLNYNVTITL